MLRDNWIMGTIRMANPHKFQAEEFFYKSLFENTLDGVAYCQMIFDARERPIDWIYVKVNKNFNTLTGLKTSVGKKVTELIPGIATSNPELFEIYGRVSLTGVSERFEVYVKPLLRWFSISVYSPKEKFFVAVFQNITKQKKIEKDLESAKIAASNVLEDLQTEKEELAKIKAKEEAMLGSIGDGIVATDKKEAIIFMNRAAETMLGWKLEEVQGKDLSNVMLVENQEGKRIAKEKRPLYSALTTTIISNRNHVYYYVKKDKTRLPTSITTAPILLGGEIIGAIEVFRDMTNEMEIEKLRTDFFSLASHQLRTPLSGAKWLIETMQRKIVGPLNQEQKEYLDRIYKSNERMIRLVSDMLNTLRFESGATLITKEIVRLDIFYKNLSVQMNDMAKSKGVTFHNAVQNRSMGMVETDSKLVLSILECFVSNAINYSVSGQEVIFDFKEERTVVFSIKDCGIGIPKNEQERIFKRFYRASNVKTFKPEGTGLGLYISSMLAEKIGGTISFEFKEGKGSTFYLRIPKKVVKQQA